MPVAPSPNKLQQLGAITKLLAELAPPVIAAVSDAVKSVRGSPDPLRAAKRAAFAAASEGATEQAIRATLKRLKK